MFKRVRLWLWAACAVPFVALAIVAALQLTRPTGSLALADSGIGGPFKLAATTGGELSNEDLKGKPYLVFFGFTRCPEVCPTTLSDISTWLAALGSQGKDLKALFISIDPERDTVPVLKDYISSFNNQIVGLTGTPAQVKKVATEFRVYYAKHKLKNGDYTMDHSAVIYLMNREGKLAGTLTYGDAKKDALEKLRQLLAIA